MTWQDAVFALGSVLFCLALVPTVRGAEKPAPSTSLLTGAVLASYVPTFLSLRLWYSAATTAVTSALWLVLLLQATRGRRGGGMGLDGQEMGW